MDMSRQTDRLAKQMLRDSAALRRQQQQAVLEAAVLRRREHEAAVAAERAAAVRRQAIRDDERGEVRVTANLRSHWLWPDVVSAVAKAAGTDQPELYWDKDHHMLGSLYLAGRFSKGLGGLKYEGKVWLAVAGAWQEVKPRSARVLSIRLSAAYVRLAERTTALQALRHERAQREALQAENTRQLHDAAVEAARRAIKVRREAESLEHVVVQTICLGCGAPPSPRGQRCRFCGTAAA
jgi:ribosomal protein L40E